MTTSPGIAHRFLTPASVSVASFHHRLRPPLAQRPPALTSDGGGGIRTRDGRKPMPVFKTGAFNRSATPPGVFAGVETR